MMCWIRLRKVCFIKLISIDDKKLKALSTSKEVEKQKSPIKIIDKKKSTEAANSTEDDSDDSDVDASDKVPTSSFAQDMGMGDLFGGDSDWVEFLFESIQIFHCNY